MLLGIDVARWQGVVDFKSVAAHGVKFCICKATHGKGLDGTFKQNWGSIKPHMVRGAYAWYIPGKDPMGQADAFVDAMVGLSNDDLPPAIDFEEPSSLPAQQLLDEVLVFVKRVRERTNRKPLLYTGKWFWQQYVKDMDSPELVLLTDLWHSEYPRTGKTGTQYDEALAALRSPNPSKPWASRGIAPKLWQFDGDKGLTLPNGVDADFNRFDGSEEEFQCWLASTIIDPCAPPVLIPPTFSTVSEVQVELLAEGYDLGPSGADGRMGPKTTDAIRSFQRDNGLESDGIVGPKTKAVLAAKWQARNS